MKSNIELAEYRDLEQEKLEEKIEGLQEELMNLRFRHSSAQLDQVSSLKNVKKSIARAKTILRRKVR